MGVTRIDLLDVVLPVGMVSRKGDFQQFCQITGHCTHPGYDIRVKKIFRIIALKNFHARYLVLISSTCQNNSQRLYYLAQKRLFEEDTVLVSKPSIHSDVLRSIVTIAIVPELHHTLSEEYLKLKTICILDGIKKDFYAKNKPEVWTGNN